MRFSVVSILALPLLVAAAGFSELEAGPCETGTLACCGSTQPVSVLISNVTRSFANMRIGYRDRIARNTRPPWDCP